MADDVNEHPAETIPQPPETSAPGRRALIASVAALVAGALAKVSPAEAQTGGSIQIDRENTAFASTRLVRRDSGQSVAGAAFEVATQDSGLAVAGFTGPTMGLTLTESVPIRQAGLVGVAVTFTADPSQADMSGLVGVVGVVMGSPTMTAAIREPWPSAGVMGIARPVPVTMTAPPGPPLLHAGVVGLGLSAPGMFAGTGSDAAGLERAMAVGATMTAVVPVGLLVVNTVGTIPTTMTAVLPDNPVAVVGLATDRAAVGGLFANLGGGTGLRVVGDVEVTGDIRVTGTTTPAASCGGGVIPAHATFADVADGHVDQNSSVSVTLTSDPGNKAAVLYVELFAGGFRIHLEPRVRRATSFTYVAFAC